MIALGGGHQSINILHSVYCVPGNVSGHTGEKTNSPTHGSCSLVAKTDIEYYVAESFGERGNMKCYGANSKGILHDSA